MSKSILITFFQEDGKNLRPQERKIKIQLSERILKHRRNLGMSMLKITQLRTKFQQVLQKKESLLTTMMMRILEIQVKLMWRKVFLKILFLIIETN